jgi:hypothetical protein
MSLMTLALVAMLKKEKYHTQPQNRRDRVDTKQKQASGKHEKIIPVSSTSQPTVSGAKANQTHVKTYY